MGGMAIRAHAPEWPARTRRVEVDLDFATRSRDRAAFYDLLSSEGYTADKRHNALFGGSQAYFVDVAAESAGRRARRQARDVPPLRLRRSPRGVEPDPPPGRAPALEAPGRQDQPEGRPGCPRPARRASARPGRWRAQFPPRPRNDQRPADPVLHLERLGLVADRHGQPRQARPVPGLRTCTRGPRPEQRPADPVRSGGPDRHPPEGDRRRARSRPAGGSGPGSANGRPGIRTPKRWATVGCDEPGSLGAH